MTGHTKIGAERMCPADLPHLTILDVRADRCTGQFDPSPWVGENWIAGLYLGRGRFLWGRFRDVDAAARTCAFCPVQLSELSMLREKASYPFIDGYWGRLAERILDEGQSWRRVAFEPSDMVVFPGPNGSSIGTRSTADEPVRGEILADG